MIFSSIQQGEAITHVNIAHDDRFHSFKIYLFEGGEGQRKGGVDSLLNVEPDMGLHPTTLRS